MANYAVIDGENVLNIIVADSKEIAEQVTGYTCIEYFNQPAEPGGTYKDGIFLPHKPHQSWVLLDQSWVPPIPYPSDEKVYVWDEESISWKEQI